MTLIGTRRAILSGKTTVAAVIPVSQTQEHSATAASGAWTASLNNNPAVGSTLLIFVTAYNALAPTTPTGWTVLASHSGTTNLRSWVFGKISAGATDKTVSMSTVSRTVAYTFQEWANAGGTLSNVVVGSFVGASSSTTFGPASVIPAIRKGTVVEYYSGNSTVAPTNITDSPPGTITTTQDYFFAGASGSNLPIHSIFHTTNEPYTGGTYTSSGSMVGGAAGQTVALMLWIKP